LKELIEIKWLREDFEYFLNLLFELHSDEQGPKVETKLYNWRTLNQEILHKLGSPLEHRMLEGVSKAPPRFVERILLSLKIIIKSRKCEAQCHNFEDAINPSRSVLETAQAATDHQHLLDKSK
jgi:hypothetical protein